MLPSLLLLRRLIVASLAATVLIAAGESLAGEFSARYLIPETLALQPARCPQPCWDGIRPGITRAEETLNRMQNNPLVTDLVRNDPSPVYPCTLEWRMTTIPIFTGCIVIRPDQPVETIILRFEDEQLRLGDAIALLGTPIAAQLCYRYDFGIRFRMNVFGTLFFPNHIIVAAYHPEPDTWRLSPAMFVKMVRYNTAEAAPAPEQAPRWQGFRGSDAYGRTCTY